MLEIFDVFKVVVECFFDILECYMVVGGFDYLMKSWVKDMEVYWVFLFDVVLVFLGVREMYIYVVMEEIKDMYIFLV